ncbi:DUF2399 domain-containing protein [Streptomyces sp. NBC_00444]|uniref:DUF2399 domain-containing protein n=1 Tax=Streptomyces sp. NBC_00444 TaxID=2975744 RepID=UPI002E250684
MRPFTCPHGGRRSRPESLTCTPGSAARVVLTLLDTLATADCTFACHGCFDWPGIGPANQVMQRYGATDAVFLTTRSRPPRLRLPLPV